MANSHRPQRDVPGWKWLGNHVLRANPNSNAAPYNTDLSKICVPGERISNRSMYIVTPPKNDSSDRLNPTLTKLGTRYSPGPRSVRFLIANGDTWSPSKIRLRAWTAQTKQSLRKRSTGICTRGRG